MSDEVNPKIPATPFGRDVIETIIPHRDPFVWVSRILEVEPGARIVGELDVDPELPLFKGHFPDHPVLPGVIIMEALAQTASMAVLLGREGALGYLVGIDKAKFRHQVAPGDTLRLEAEILKANRRMVTAQVAAYVGDNLAASAVQKYVLDESGR